MGFFFRSPSERFWKWFQKNEDRLFSFEKAQERVFAELTTELHRVCPDLTFEFSLVEDGKRELVIGAEGLKRAFPAVEKLVGCAPSLPRWTFIKFRPRRWPLNDLRVAGVEVKAFEVEVCLCKHEGRLALIVFIPGIVDQRLLAHFGFLFLDEALGEYDVATKVGAIEFHPASVHSDYPRFPLPELPRRFDSAYAGMTDS